MNFKKNYLYFIAFLIVCAFSFILSILEIVNYQTTFAAQGREEISYHLSDGAPTLESPNNKFVRIGRSYIVDRKEICSAGTIGFFLNATLEPHFEQERYFFQSGVKDGFRVGIFTSGGQETLRVTNFSQGHTDHNVDIDLREIFTDSKYLSLQINILQNSDPGRWNLEVKANGKKKFRAIRPLVAWECDTLLFGAGRSWEQSWEGEISIEYGLIEDGRDERIQPKFFFFHFLITIGFIVITAVGSENLKVKERIS